MIIAIDGPAASGKGTLAKKLAAHYGLPHLDTGLLYRAAAFNLLEMGGDPESEFQAARATDISQMQQPIPKIRDMELLPGLRIFQFFGVGGRDNLSHKSAAPCRIVSPHKIHLRDTREVQPCLRVTLSAESYSDL